MPSVFGRMCHLFCERATPRLDGIPGPALKALERFVGDYGDPALTPLVPERPPSGKRVAVIGAGSGGLGGAWMLRRLGHEVDVYDMLDVPGGQLFTGYPPFRMAKFGVRRDNDPTAWGARFLSGVKVTRAMLERIVNEYDLTLVTIGLYDPRLLGIPGEEAEGVWNALDFIGAVGTGHPPEHVRRVLIIGAGGTARDASRTALRLGAEVTICYRRSWELMDMGGGPMARQEHIDSVEGEGIPIVCLIQPLRILTDAAGHVAGVEFIRTEMGPPAEDGRPEICYVPGTEFVMACDTVVEAVGEAADLRVFPESIQAEHGFVVVDRATHQTSHPKVFAAGDIIGDHGNEGAAHAAMQAARTMDSVLRREPLVRFEPKSLRRG